MIEIRIHGRGGQGAVILSKIIAYGYFLKGMFSQSHPTFGAERRGAPVAAFVRADEEFIFLRAPVTSCDYVIVLDSHLAETEDILFGLKKNGLVLINSKKTPKEFHISTQATVYTLDMNSVALKYKLGSRIAPYINAVAAGGFGGLTQEISHHLLKESIKRFIPIRPEENILAMELAYKTGKGLIGRQH